MFLAKKFKQDTYDILPEFNSRFDFKTINTQLQKILRDIIAILTLRKGSQVYNIDNGTNLFDYIWDNITESLLSNIELEVKNIIKSSLNMNVNKVVISRDSNNVHVVNINIVLVLTDTRHFDILLKLSKEGFITVDKASEIISKIIIN